MGTPLSRQPERREPIGFHGESDSPDNAAPAGAEHAVLEHGDLTSIISPDELRMISESSGGFYYEPDPSLPPGSMGYTHKITKVIRYNPTLLLARTRHEVRGFFIHEAGHHADQVLDFDDRLIADLKNPGIIPEAYRGDRETEERFLAAIYRHLDNGLVDIWLEAYQSRRPYYGLRHSLRELNIGMGEMPSYQQFPKPEQLMQLILRQRYMPDSDEVIRKKVDPEVYESYQRIQKARALEALMDTSYFEEFFASDRDKERSIELKERAYREVFLPEHLKLIEAELKKREQEQQKQQKGGQGEGQKDEEGEEGEEGEDQEGQPGQPGESSTPGKKGKRRGSSQPSPMGQDSSVPLTKEEMQRQKKQREQILRQILQELIEEGDKRASQAPAKEEEQGRKQGMGRAQQAQEQRREREEGLKEGQTPEPSPDGQEEGPDSEEMLRQLARMLERNQQDRARRGLAEGMKVRAESVQKWERIREKYREDIESLAAVLADIFVDDRRARLEFLVREGEIVPGLEQETIAALLSGQLDPDTKMKTIKNLEFLETEMEFIVDTSGSMAGDKIEQSIILMVIVTEAFRRIRQILNDEGLLTDDTEQPLRVGVTRFDTNVLRVTKLDEQLDDKKELEIIDKTAATGGGTDEKEALATVIGDLKLRAKNVIKLVVVLTDGAGNVAGVRPIIQQVEADDEVIFVAVGLGHDATSAKGIVETYVSATRKGKEETNVHGLAKTNPKEVIPDVIDILKREVPKRRQW